MKLIKLLVLSTIFCITQNIQAKTISGIVSVKGKVPKGTLYIFAKKYGSSMPMPLAVLKIESPSFPVKFTLGESNKMIPSMPFIGPFVVIARISPSGSATDKTDLEVKTSKAINLGQQEIKLSIIGQN
jgi:hypothetical protein